MLESQRIDIQSFKRTGCVNHLSALEFSHDRKTVTSFLLRRVVLWSVAMTAIGSAQPISQAQTNKATPPGVAIVGVNVVPLASDGVLYSQTVLVQGDRIVDVRSAGSVEIAPDWLVVDGSESFLIPGLADMHVHIRDASELVSYLRYGVTTVLQMGNHRLNGRSIPETREMPGFAGSASPNLYSTGRILSGRGSAAVNTSAAVHAALESDHAAGYDFVKVHNMLPPSAYRAALERASELGVAVVGHLPFLVKPDDVLGSGQRMVAHAELFYYAYYLDRSCIGPRFWNCTERIVPLYEDIPRIVQTARAAGVYVTANLSYIAAPRTLMAEFHRVMSEAETRLLAPSIERMWQADDPGRRASIEAYRADLERRYPFTVELVRALHDSGVPLLAGTDADQPGLFPGRSLHLELEELVRAGLTPIQALRAATTTPARFLAETLGERADTFGAVAAGQRADLVLLAANPLENIHNTRSIQGVMVRGIWRSIEQLESLRR